jgi:RAD51-like protein 3
MCSLINRCWANPGGSSFFDSTVTTTSIISTGCNALDDLLDGGIFTGEITEVTGSDQTEVCLSILLAVASDMKKNVVFFDTANRFDVFRLGNTMRLRNMAPLEIEESLRRIRVVRAFDVFDFLDKLNSLSDGLSVHTDSFYTSLKLIVVDGLVDGIFPTLSGCREEGCGYVAQIAGQLRMISCDFSLAVLVNRLTVGSSAKMAPVVRVWSAVPATRIEIRDVAEQVVDQRLRNETVKVREVILSKSSRQRTGSHMQMTVDETGLLGPS